MSSTTTGNPPSPTSLPSLPAEQYLWIHRPLAPYSRFSPDGKLQLTRGSPYPARNSIPFPYNPLPNSSYNRETKIPFITARSSTPSLFNPSPSTPKQPYGNPLAFDPLSIHHLLM
ncbi:hypothetical protein M413DRAFT_448625 [Hebeloma cylindrosporum]|uniref:Uncharacterized protein n=1 Tax=Hebeloma cylindrosporum TaxID=76867 RepID=A0A0C2Y8J5_HEBCY|nr:hypothetical protein M413DRAFT_448625 [Hebeloma cylindrosporum h7]